MCKNINHQISARFAIMTSSIEEQGTLFFPLKTRFGSGAAIWNICQRYTYTFLSKPVFTGNIVIFRNQKSQTAFRKMAMICTRQRRFAFTIHWAKHIESEERMEHVPQELFALHSASDTINSLFSEVNMAIRKMILSSFERATPTRFSRKPQSSNAVNIF